MPDLRDLERVAALRDRDLRAENVIVVEGLLLVERMLDAGILPYAIVATPDRAEALEQRLAGRAPLTVRSAAEICAITGFKFHRGVLACAQRPVEESLASFLAASPETRRLVLCPTLADRVNLGAILRSAAALGWNRIVIGEGSADPWTRLALRTAMGAQFLRPPLRLTDPEAGAACLRAAGFRIAGAIAEPGAISYRDFCAPPRLALVIGHEFEGMDEAWRTRCDAFLTIPMAPGVDSLNAAAAAAVLMAGLAGELPGED